mmetsp:Transcript_28002/g.64106  ORF Transcript_28002/g.64106 Transcript_28002/m.64106 type:complete len:216 (-) Transcript_28002:41-688(-)
MRPLQDAAGGGQTRPPLEKYAGKIFRRYRRPVVAEDAAGGPGGGPRRPDAYLRKGRPSGGASRLGDRLRRGEGRVSRCETSGRDQIGRHQLSAGGQVWCCDRYRSQSARSYLDHRRIGFRSVLDLRERLGGVLRFHRTESAAGRVAEEGRRGRRRTRRMRAVPGHFSSRLFGDTGLEEPIASPGRSGGFGRDSKSFRKRGHTCSLQSDSGFREPQ